MLNRTLHFQDPKESPDEIYTFQSTNNVRAYLLSYSLSYSSVQGERPQKHICMAIDDL